MNTIDKNNKDNIEQNAVSEELKTEDTETKNTDKKSITTEELANKVDTLTQTLSDFIQTNRDNNKNTHTQPQFNTLDTIFNTKESSYKESNKLADDLDEIWKAEIKKAALSPNE